MPKLHEIVNVPAENRNDAAVKPYSEEELEKLNDPKIQQKIEQLLSFFDFHGIDYGKYDKIKNWDKDLPLKKAYPNIDPIVPQAEIYNTQKWLNAVKDIYYEEKNKLSRVQAIKNVTANWKRNEIFHFLNWLKFYEEGAHLKYKMATTVPQIKKEAQMWYENGAPGYFLKLKHDKPVDNAPAIAPQKNIDFAEDGGMTMHEKKSIIEKQRSKIIGRLDSAEKLLRSSDGQLFAGKELEVLMEAIYALKKKIQLVNKISSSIRLYEDMIIREANILSKNGFYKAGQVLQNVAEQKDEEKPADNSGKIPVTTPKAAPLPSSGKGTPENPPAKMPLPAIPANPVQSSGAPGGLPSMGPGMPQTPPESAQNDFSPVDPNSGLNKFLENLSTNNITTKEDKGEAEDDILEVQDELLVSEAQEISPAPVNVEKPIASGEGRSMPPKQEDLEVSENVGGEDKGNTVEKTTEKPSGDIIDAAFANVKIEDIIERLNAVNKIFKIREIPRQLAVIDLMLNAIGLSPFTNELSEASSKSLDANNYIGIRLDELISKLNGAISSKNIDLTKEKSLDNPQIDKIKNVLQQNEQKEKDRKQKRKEQENADIDTSVNKETPNIEINEDLGTKIPPKTQTEI